MGQALSAFAVDARADPAGQPHHWRRAVAGDGHANVAWLVPGAYSPWYSASRSFACAAASRATGTRGPEQET